MLSYSPETLLQTLTQKPQLIQKHENGREVGIERVWWCLVILISYWGVFIVGLRLRATELGLNLDSLACSSIGWGIFEKLCCWVHVGWMSSWMSDWWWVFRFLFCHKHVSCRVVGMVEALFDSCMWRVGFSEVWKLMFVCLAWERRVRKKDSDPCMCFAEIRRSMRVMGGVY